MITILNVIGDFNKFPYIVQMKFKDKLSGSSKDKMEIEIINSTRTIENGQVIYSITAIWRTYGWRVYTKMNLLRYNETKDVMEIVKHKSIELETSFTENYIDLDSIGTLFNSSTDIAKRMINIMGNNGFD